MTRRPSEDQNAVQSFVNREVHYCVSSLVSTLAMGMHAVTRNTDMGAVLSDLTEQAMELASPIPDYEEAAIQAGWEDVTTSDFPDCTQFHDTTDGQKWVCSGWQALCEEFDIDPVDREVYEHWIVSDWLADELAEKGEKVNKDFAGLTIWARTTTGQGISSDAIIERIYDELHTDAAEA